MKSRLTVAAVGPFTMTLNFKVGFGCLGSPITNSEGGLVTLMVLSAPKAAIAVPEKTKETAIANPGNARLRNL